MGLNGKAHAGAINDESSEIKTPWLWFRLLRRAESRGSPGTSAASVSPAFIDSQWSVTEPLNADIMTRVAALAYTFLVRTQLYQRAKARHEFTAHG
jgi:hypothetical protein